MPRCAAPSSPRCRRSTTSARCPAWWRSTSDPEKDIRESAVTGVTRLYLPRESGIGPSLTRVVNFFNPQRSTNGPTWSSSPISPSTRRWCRRCRPGSRTRTTASASRRRAPSASCAAVPRCRCWSLAMKEDRNTSVRFEAIRALGKIGDTTAAKDVLPFTLSTEAKLRTEAGADGRAPARPGRAARADAAVPEGSGAAEAPGGRAVPRRADGGDRADRRPVLEGAVHAPARPRGRRGPCPGLRRTGAGRRRVADRPSYRRSACPRPIRRSRPPRRSRSTASAARNTSRKWSRRWVAQDVGSGPRVPARAAPGRGRRPRRAVAPRRRRAARIDRRDPRPDWRRAGQAGAAGTRPRHPRPGRRRWPPRRSSGSRRALAAAAAPTAAAQREFQGPRTKAWPWVAFAVQPHGRGGRSAPA